MLIKHFNFPSVLNFIAIFCFIDKIPKNISAETDLSPRAKATKDHTTTNTNELNFKVKNIVNYLK